MSSDMATANSEFKVVQTKRSSNQGRRGMARDRYNSDRYGYSGRGGLGPRHGSSGHAPSSEEPGSTVTRKKTPLQYLHQKAGDKGDREIRLRPQTGRSSSGQSRSGNSSSSSSVGGGSGRDSSSDSYHHSGRHRSSSNSMDPDSGKIGKVEKSITSPNRFEKLENLDPDVEDSVLEPSSSSEALKGSNKSSLKGGDTDKKRDRDKSSAPSSSSNYRGKKGGSSSVTRGVKGDPEGSRTTGKNELENELQTSKDSKSLENDSECNETDISGSTNCKNASSSSSGIEAGPSHESLSGAEEQLDLSQDSLQEQQANGKRRISYSRDCLLKLKNHPLSRTKPKLSIGDVYVSPPGSFNDTDQSSEDTRPKHVTTMSFLKEHESKQYSSTSSTSSRQYDRDGAKPYSRQARDSRQDWRQQKNSRYDQQRYHHGQEWEEEPEPEWMEFGPTDRFDVIELKGFDKEELEREANMESRDQPLPTERNETPDWEEEEVVAENKDTAGVDIDSGTGGKGETSEQKREVKEEERVELVKEEEKTKAKKPKAVANQAHKEAPSAPGSNEYILDGFDFSTGLSICQELALDEDEEEGREVVGGEDDDLLQTAEVQTPVQLSNALMKALKVGGHDSAGPSPTQQQPKNQDDRRLVSMGNRPVNALTLDEIHARENIHPMNEPSGKTSDDLGAFNKLVAVLQSSGDIRNEKGSTPPTPSSVSEPQLQQFQQKQPLPPKAMPTATPTAVPLPKEEQRVSPTSESANFGFLLEEELDFDDEAAPSIKGEGGPTPVVPPSPMSAPSYQRPTLPASSLPQQDYPPHSRPAPPTSLIGRGDPSPIANLMGRGDPGPPPIVAPPQPSMNRLEAIADMLEKLDRSHRQTAAGYNDIPPSPVLAPPNLLANKMRMEQRQQQLAAMHMEREREREREKERERERGWRYPEGFMDASGHPNPELLRSMPPPPRQLPGVGGRNMMSGPPPMPPSSSNRPNSNQWAIEMERRRVFELQQMQMRERERMYQQQRQQQQHQQQYGMNAPPQAKMMPPGPSSKPNISLLPTSVMRHIHNTKSNHPFSEMSKTSGATSMPNRVDQEMMGKVSQSHSGMSSMLNHSADSGPPPVEYPPSSQMMPAPPPGHAHPNAAMMYPPYTPIPQRMSGQHNPYNIY